MNLPLLQNIHTEKHIMEPWWCFFLVNSMDAPLMVELDGEMDRLGSTISSKLLFDFNFIVLAYRFYYTSQWRKALFCLHRLQWRNSESGKIPFTVHRCLPDGRRVWTDFVFITVHSTYLLSLSIVICGSVHSYDDWGVDELIVEDSWKQQVAGDWVVFSLVFSVPIILPGLSFAACWYLETQFFSIVLGSPSFFFPLEFDGNCHLWKCGLSRDTNWYCAYGNRQVWAIFIFFLV